LGTDPDALVFNPYSNSGDITVLGYVAAMTFPDPDGGIFAKYEAAGDKRSWLLYVDVNGKINFQISKNGAHVGGSSQIAEAPSSLSQGFGSFVGGSYKFVADGTSVIRAYLDDNVGESTSGEGPIYSSTDAPVWVANYRAAAGRHTNLRTFWLAYYDRRLATAEIDSVRRLQIKPWDVEDCSSYMEFSQNPVEATYTTEYPDEAGHEFTVNGDPIPDNIGGGGSRHADYVPGVDPHLEFALWKCRNADLIQLASDDSRAVGMRFRAVAMEDVDGDYGGSAIMPYGYVKCGVIRGAN
jgi:hypothetical protein